MKAWVYQDGRLVAIDVVETCECDRLLEGPFVQSGDGWMMRCACGLEHYWPHRATAPRFERV